MLPMNISKNNNNDLCRTRIVLAGISDFNFTFSRHQMPSSRKGPVAFRPSLTRGLALFTVSSLGFSGSRPSVCGGLRACTWATRPYIEKILRAYMKASQDKSQGWVDKVGILLRCEIQTYRLRSRAIFKTKLD